MNTKTTPKDFFLHFGATIALYVAAGALINLAFTVTDYYLPDALAGYFYGNAVAWPISMLIVLVPILYVLEWLINRDITKMPEKADIWIRKWRVYLTLFLVVVLMGGDLITLINTYLNGEITARLIWKVVVVLVIASAIGKYYFFNLYRTSRWSTFARRVIPWWGALLVLVAIVAGFIAVGSPAKQRALRFDTTRVNDLSTIQWQIINYWQTKEKLPVALADLNDSLSSFIVPTDPETKAAYEYSVKAVSGTKIIPGGLSFELCAIFGESSPDTKGRGAYGGGLYPIAYDTSMSYPNPGGVDNVWDHTKGRVCFDRTIDPDKYPIIPKPVKN